MKDREFMEHAYKGNQDAIRMVLDFARVAGVWDDLVDKDKPVTEKDINDAFWLALAGIPGNPFYQRHMQVLQPLIQTAIVNWWLSNAMQGKAGRSQEIAHVLRYSIADVATYVAFLIGGYDWAKEVGPELRLRSQKDDLANFLKEHGGSDAKRD